MKNLNNWKNHLIMISILFIFVVLGLASASNGPSVRKSSDGLFEYVILNDNLHITNYNGISTDIVIPEQINGKNVIAIGTPTDRKWDYYGTIFNGRNITSVVIPNTVINIYSNAFSNNKLTTVEIPESVVSIGPSSFLNNQLTNVILSKNVKTIAASAFANNNIKNVVIPKNVTNIYNRAFENNQITYVDIPGSVTEIGYGAFSSNYLTNVNISEGVINISYNAFANNQLTSITIPQSVTTINNNAFLNNPLKSIVFSGRVRELSRNSLETLTPYYFSNSKRSGTYTWNEVNWLFNDTPLTRLPVILKGDTKVTITAINNNSGNWINGYSVDNNEYWIPHGNYSISLRYTGESTTYGPSQAEADFYTNVLGRSAPTTTSVTQRAEGTFDERAFTDGTTYQFSATQNNDNMISFQIATQ